MDRKESKHLQQEIAYWKNLISSHKRSAVKHKYYGKSFESQRHNYIPNRTFKSVSANPIPYTTRKELQKPNSYFEKTSSYSSRSSKLSSTSGVAKQQLRRINHCQSEARVAASAKYKWNNNSLQYGMQTAASASKKSKYQYKNHQTLVSSSIPSSSTVARNTSLSAKSTTPKSISSSNAVLSMKSVQSINPKTASQFKWSKNMAVSHALSSGHSVSSHNATNLEREMKPGDSHNFSRPRTTIQETKRLNVSSNASANRLSNSKVKALAMKKLVNKYKLVRDSNSRCAFNMSSNPYKVIRRNSSTHNYVSFNKQNITRFRRNTSKHNHYLKRNQNGYYVNENKFTKNNAVYRKKHILTNNRYKLVHPPVQTRSRKSGNIVLKRKQLQSRALKNKFTFIKHSSASTTKQRLASHALHRSIEMARSKNRHKVKKVYCIFYNRFGKCNRGEKCPYTHDPERVAICTQFLRGTCKNTSCPFSHKVSMHKMPVCRFFLRGKCSTKNCPYLHVFVGHNAPICNNFATVGYCCKADNCKELHVRACPDFYEKGKCERGKKCNLPHKHRRKPQSFGSILPNSQSESTSRKLVRSEQSVLENGIDFISLPKQSLTAQTQDPPLSTSDAASEVMRIQPRLKLKPSKQLAKQL